MARSVLPIQPAMFQPEQVIVVRRGEAQLFEVLRDRFATGTAPAQVIWDRRMRDRRVIIRDDVDPERRRVERRASEPPSWTTQGYLIAQPRPVSDDASRPQGKAQALIEAATRPGAVSPCGHAVPRGLRTDEDHVRLYARTLRQSGRQLSGEWLPSRLRSL